MRKPQWPRLFLSIVAIAALTVRADGVRVDEWIVLVLTYGAFWHNQPAGEQDREREQSPR